MISGLSIIGLVAIAFGIASHIRSKFIFAKGYSATGKIIDFQPDAMFFSGTQSTREYPIIEYIDEDQTRKSGQLSVSNTIESFKRGDTVNFIKHHGKLHPANRYTIRNLIIVIVGIIIAIVGAFID